VTELLPATFFSFAAGLICGFLSSSPLGSINLWIIARILNDGARSARIIWYLLGVVSADLTYAALAAWGYHALFSDTAAEAWIAGLGGSFLILLGVLALRRHADEGPADPGAKTASPLRQWLLGVFMCGSNPGFLLFWIYAIDQLENHFAAAFTGQALWFFLAGIAAGDLLWFGLLITGIGRFRHMVSEKINRVVNRAVGAAFIVIGVVSIIKIL
jgi:threonine/homoserine/homoserine lactone efflux protein